MPIRQNTVYCVNHPDVPMTRSADFFALTAVHATSEGVEFRADQGMPLLVLMCEICGFIETYAAAKTVYWANGPQGVVEPQTEKDINFAKLAKDILMKDGKALGFSKIVKDVPIGVGDGGTLNIDLIGNRETGVALFEAIAGDSGRRFESAAMHARRLATLYLLKFPGSNPKGYLIVPSTAPVDDNVMGVQILKIDVEKGAIVSPVVW